MKTATILLMALLAMPAAAFTQTGQGSGAGGGSGSGTGSGSGSGSGSGRGDAQANREAALRAELEKLQAATKEQQGRNDPFARFVRTLTNVQIELVLTDQMGTQPSEKKTVSMIASSGNWGKIRSAANVHPIGEPPYSVELNVDARPFVTTDGMVQLELTLVYAPVKGSGDPKEGPRQRPSGVNQSQTVILQSGKPLVVSQAADPVSDRKVVVEVKATVLK
jgi:hypothetical protein